MRSRGLRSSSRPPVSERDLELYADKWVVVRAGKVVLQASSYDVLLASIGSGRLKEADAIHHLPPVTPFVTPS
jgi:hypothetical protein